MEFKDQTLTDQDIRSERMAQLHAVEALAPDWNGYGAPAIERDVIQRVEQFLEAVGTEQPDRVVPSGRGTVQLEYEVPQGKYLEIEFAADAIGFLYQSATGDEVEQEDVSLDQAIAITHRYHAA